MNNVELYINGQLTDTAGLSVRLNRLIIKPSELNTKDSQYSYSIELPPTFINAQILGYANVEETRDKFNRVYTAELIIDSVRIFDGLFRLSSVRKSGYKGNLYKPALKSIKDIFGDINLNQLPELRIEFRDFTDYVSAYNEAAKTSPQTVIFPYVLYGLLPKVPNNKDTNSYTARDLWDATVRLGMQDLPPSFNVLHIMRHIFESQGYNLTGTAFDDEKLVNLYMSYKNPDDYVQPWNYGEHAKMRITGQWGSAINKRTGGVEYEKGVMSGYDNGFQLFATDFFDSTNASLQVVQDTGNNILNKLISDIDGRMWNRTQIRIPTSGFYKVEFNASIRVDDDYAWRFTDPETGVQHVSGYTQNANNNFYNKMYEVRLIRDWGRGDFALGAARINGTFYQNNQPQNTTFDENNVPKYFPQQLGNTSINFIDMAQDRNMILGFHWGRRGDWPEYINPRDSGMYAHAQAAKPALSWDNTLNDQEIPRLAVQSAGYWKYGRIGTYDNEGDNPAIIIDYSGGDFRQGFKANNRGELIPATADDVVLYRFPINRHYNFRITLPQGTVYEDPVTIIAQGQNAVSMVLFFTGNVLEFNTSAFPDTVGLPTITMQVQTADYDVNGSMTIEQFISQGSEDVVDWEITERHHIELQNAPANFTQRGLFEGQQANDEWNGQGEINAVVWFNAGELVTVASVTEEGRYRQNGMHSTFGWTRHEVHFDLSIQPFRVDAEWLKVSTVGNGITPMNWNDPVNFDTDSINVAGFLPSNVKTNDFIDNFVKAFNLQLSQLDETNFRLDLKQSKTSVSNEYLDIDGIAAVDDRENTALGIPSLYRLGFTVDQEEEGYVRTKDDGGGEYETGATEGAIVEQKSTFSYNWFKPISKVETGGNIVLLLPIISKNEPWLVNTNYGEQMLNRYTDQAARFWYFDGLLNDQGASFDFNGEDIKLARVSNNLRNVSYLNYKNQRATILRNYFTLLIDASSHYTDVEAFLTPQMYEALDGSIKVKFNGDLYYIAEISGYDPAGRNKTKLKLIRQI